MRVIYLFLYLISVSFVSGCNSMRDARIAGEFEALEKNHIEKEKSFLPIFGAKIPIAGTPPDIAHLNNHAYPTDQEKVALYDLFALRSQFAQQWTALLRKHGAPPALLNAYDAAIWRIMQLRASLIDSKITYSQYNAAAKNSEEQYQKEYQIIIEGAQKRAMEEQRMRSAQSLQMLQMGTQILNSQPPAIMNTGPRIYNMNGRTVTCTTTGAITNCL
jgi:hypothetical protein